MTRTAYDYEDHHIVLWDVPPFKRGVIEVDWGRIESEEQGRRIGRQFAADALRGMDSLRMRRIERGYLSFGTFDVGDARGNLIPPLAPAHRRLLRRIAAALHALNPLS